MRALSLSLSFSLVSSLSLFPLLFFPLSRACKSSFAHSDTNAHAQREEERGGQQHQEKERKGEREERGRKHACKRETWGETNRERKRERERKRTRGGGKEVRECVHT